VSAADGQLLRPADEPTLARNIFSWEDALNESLVRRVELRKQKWMVKRRELELIASRNYLLPKLDVVSLYRFYAGHDLIGRRLFRQYMGNLTTGDFQEWAVGVELRSPSAIGVVMRPSVTLNSYRGIEPCWKSRNNR
jgi:hypothetical protein